MRDSYNGLPCQLGQKFPSISTAGRMIFVDLRSVACRFWFAVVGVSVVLAPLILCVSFQFSPVSCLSFPHTRCRSRSILRHGLLVFWTALCTDWTSSTFHFQVSDPRTMRSTLGRNRISIWCRSQPDRYSFSPSVPASSEHGMAVLVGSHWAIAGAVNPHPFVVLCADMGVCGGPRSSPWYLLWRWRACRRS